MSLKDFSQVTLVLIYKHTPPSLTSQTKTGVEPFNPGRMNVAGDVFQNGESASHHSPGKL